MLIRLTGNRKNYDFDFEVGQDELEPEPDITAEYEKIRVAGKLERLPDDEFHLRFNLTGKITYPCSRCLEPVEVDADYEFDEIFNLEGNYVVGLDEYINDCLFINEPPQILCKPDCKGLCPMCGADLNKTQCDCQEEEFYVDPRLEKLRQLL